MQNEKGFINNYKYPESDHNRPWGWWETTSVGFLPDEQGAFAFCDKIICVNPGVHLSLQVHNYREEYWLIKKGSVTVYVGETPHALKAYPLNAGDKIHIPCGSWHSIENTGAEQATFAEKQIGILLDEKDIVRKNDPRGYDKDAVEEQRKTVETLGIAKHWPPYPKNIYPTNAPDYCFPEASVSNFSNDS